MGCQEEDFIARAGPSSTIPHCGTLAAGRTGTTRAPRARQMIAHGFNRGWHEEGTRVPGDDTGFCLAPPLCRARGTRFVKRRLPTVETMGFLISSRRAGLGRKRFRRERGVKWLVEGNPKKLLPPPVRSALHSSQAN